MHGILSAGRNRPRRKEAPTTHAETLAALAEPQRLRIVELLARGPLTVGEIAARLDLRQPQASKHLRVLADAGLVEVEAIANRRRYRLRPDPFRELDVWLVPYRELWQDRYDRLDDYLDRLQGSARPEPASSEEDPP